MQRENKRMRKKKIIFVPRVRESFGKKMEKGRKAWGTKRRKGEERKEFHALNFFHSRFEIGEYTVLSFYLILFCFKLYLCEYVF